MKSVEYYIGKDVIPALHDYLAKIPSLHIFLVRGKASYSSCGAETVLSSVFSSLNCQLTTFTAFSPNPKIEEVRAGVDILMKSEANFILAVGGGSALDVAKSIRHYAAEKGKVCKLAAIPTTAGTGAEATKFAVVYINGKKQSLEADDILPDIAFVYPPFTYHNSPYLTACTGFDALAQAIEAFWNKNANEESDKYALKAIALLHNQLPLCVSHSTDALRDDIATGAYWAGRAISITKTTAPHAFSYAFTTHCEYPHGHAVALTFPFFAELNTKDTPKEPLLRKALNLEDSVSLREYFVHYSNNIGLSFTGTKGHSLIKLLQEVNPQRLSNNPVVVNDEIILQLQDFLLQRELHEGLFRYNPEGSVLRRAQLRMVEILKVVDAICKKNKIEYTLACGSLLGAVRHGGFIPWDDDLDINVMRKDMPRLKKALQKELPDNLVYQDFFTEPYFPTPLAKVRDKHSYFYDEECTDKYKEKGIFIDIIPIEDVPNLAWKKKLDYWYGHCLRGIHHYAGTKDTVLSWIVLPFAWTLTTLTRFVNKFRHIDQLAHVYGFWAYNSIPKKDFYPIKRISFEGFQACVPNNPDAVLTRFFGNYMQLPPEEKRTIHNQRIEIYDEDCLSDR